MAATKGNRFWEMRSKHGRDKIFATPNLMWEAAAEFFKWCEDNPIKDPRSFGQRKIQRPFTIQGLVSHFDCNVNYLQQFEDGLKPSEKEIDKDFSLIISRIREIIYRQKFENAVIGVYNPLIISRDLGQSEKTENKNTHDGELIIKGKKFANND